MRGRVRAVVQRVSRAEVRVEGRATGRIDRGLAVLLGVARDDGDEDVRLLADKVAALRVFEDGAGKMNLALAEVGGSVLVVSQFTLLGDARKGNRPSFVDAPPPERRTRSTSGSAPRCGRRGSPSRRECSAPRWSSSS
jgi:D-tyrosyl-tRNA(Tyr) deacylase